MIQTDIDAMYFSLNVGVSSRHVENAIQNGMAKCKFNCVVIDTHHTT